MSVHESWLTTAPDSTTHGLLTLRPELGPLVQAMLDELWLALDRQLLELCRIHVSRTIGDPIGASERTPGVTLPDGVVEASARWWSSPLVGPRERACLAYTEQFVLDVHGITDEHHSAIAAHLSAAEQVAFTTALGLFDGLARMRVALGATSQSPNKIEVHP